MRCSSASHYCHLALARGYQVDLPDAEPGTLLENGRDLNDTDQVFAVMLIIIVIGIAIDGLIFGPLERRVRERWGLSR